MLSRNNLTVFFISQPQANHLPTLFPLPLLYIASPQKPGWTSYSFRPSFTDIITYDISLHYLQWYSSIPPPHYLIYLPIVFNSLSNFRPIKNRIKVYLSICTLSWTVICFITSNLHHICSKFLKKFKRHVFF